MGFDDWEGPMLRVATVQLAACDGDQADLELDAALAAVHAVAAEGAQLAVLPTSMWPTYPLRTEHDDRCETLPTSDAVIERFADTPHLDEARRREMARGTDVAQGRQPSSCGTLMATTPGND